MVPTLLELPTHTQPYQGLSIDRLLSLAGVGSENSTRRSVARAGLRFETRRMILATDRFTGRKHGDSRVSKENPVERMAPKFSLSRCVTSRVRARVCVPVDGGGEAFNKTRRRQSVKVVIQPCTSSDRCRCCPSKRRPAAHLAFGVSRWNRGDPNNPRPDSRKERCRASIVTVVYLFPAQDRLQGKRPKKT